LHPIKFLFFIKHYCQHKEIIKKKAIPQGQTNNFIKKDMKKAKLKVEKLREKFVI
jgi:hypothetical protein